MLLHHFFFPLVIFLAVCLQKFTIRHTFFWVALTEPLLAWASDLYPSGIPLYSEHTMNKDPIAVPSLYWCFFYTLRGINTTEESYKNLLFLPSLRLKPPFWWSKYTHPSQLDQEKIPSLFYIPYQVITKRLRSCKKRRNTPPIYSNYRNIDRSIISKGK